MPDWLEQEVEKRFEVDKTKYFTEDRTESSYACTAAVQLLEFTLDDKEDMHMSGKTQFQFQGIEVADKSNKSKSVQQMVQQNDVSIAIDKESQQSPGEEEAPSCNEASGTR